MKKIIIGNWKCNPTSSRQAENLFKSIVNGVKETKNTEIVICPSFVYLTDLRLTTNNLRLGAQDCFWEQEGPFTGEISPKMLKNLGCKYVILGHSERRQFLNETDEMIGKKLKAAFDAGLRPILCIGETLEQRKQGKTQEILEQQLNVLSDLAAESPSRLMIAYEPVWAIGAGNACNPQDARQILSFLKKYLQLNESRSRWQKIIYGGSVDSKNANDYIDIGFDGLLVGGASLDAKEFVKIVKKVDKINFS